MCTLWLLVCVIFRLFLVTIIEITCDLIWFTCIIQNAALKSAEKKRHNSGVVCSRCGSQSITLVFITVPSLAKGCTLWPEGSNIKGGRVLLGHVATLAYIVLLIIYGLVVLQARSVFSYLVLWLSISLWLEISAQNISKISEWGYVVELILLCHCVGGTRGIKQVAPTVQLCIPVITHSTSICSSFSKYQLHKVYPEIVFPSQQAHLWVVWSCDKWGKFVSNRVE